MKLQLTTFTSANVMLVGLFHCWFPLLSAKKEGETCTLKGNLPGKCITTSMCEPIIVKYVQSGRLTIDDVITCGLGTYEEIVCCPVNECCPAVAAANSTTNTFKIKSAPTPTVPVVPSNRADVPNARERPAARACRQLNNPSNKEILARHIINGVAVNPGVYPHMAAIAFSNPGSFQYRCGGSLISNRHVLTAAHCINSLSDPPVHVRLGTVDIEEVGKHYKDIRITDNITVHPEYVSGSKYNDIAILELAEEVAFNSYIQAACLETDIEDPPAYSKAYVAGWGFTNKSRGLTSKILLRAPLNIVPRLECNQSLLEQPTTLGSIRNGVNELLICAKDVIDETSDACQGDSGGPLMFERDIGKNNYTIIGIISSGFGCATRTPGLYTRVSAFLSFIEEVVWPNNVV